MKTVGFVLLTLSQLISPSLAANYQGQPLDGRKLAAKVYSYETGGVYEAQVRFEGDRAAIEFAGGGQLTLQLKQSEISNLQQIEGYGSLGQIPIGRFFSLGLSQRGTTDRQAFPSSSSLQGFWSIRIDPTQLDSNPAQR